MQYSQSGPVRTIEQARHDAESLPIGAINPNRPDLFAADLIGPYFERLRRDAPAHYTRESADGPFWSITRFADVQAVEADHARFSSDARLGGIHIGGVANPAALPMFISMDPPQHGLRRRTIAPAFASDVLQSMAAAIRAETRHILDALPVADVFDWAQTAASDFAAMALAVLFDFPQDQRHRLTRWSDIGSTLFDFPADGMLRPADDTAPLTIAQRNAELAECLATFDALWLDSAADSPRDNLISMLAHGPATRDMPLLELQGNVVLLVVAGHETTSSTLSGSILQMDRNRNQFARLRADRSLLPGMIAEAIRWQSGVGHMRRTAVADVEMHGQLIRRGDKVVLWYVSANRDSAAIADPDLFLIDRPDPNRHIAFGHGVHRCIGSRFAEMTLTIAWEEMLDRFSHIEVVGEPVRLASTFNHGFAHLPVRLHR